MTRGATLAHQESAKLLAISQLISTKLDLDQLLAIYVVYFARPLFFTLWSAPGVQVFFLLALMS